MFTALFTGTYCSDNTEPANRDTTTGSTPSLDIFQQLWGFIWERGRPAGTKPDEQTKTRAGPGAKSDGGHGVQHFTEAEGHGGKRERTGCYTFTVCHPSGDPACWHCVQHAAEAIKKSEPHLEDQTEKYKWKTVTSQIELFFYFFTFCTVEILFVCLKPFFSGYLNYK